MSLTSFTTFGSYGFDRPSALMNSMIGRTFFYNDEEVGIGWESKIDNIWHNEMDFGYTLELSCGTRVNISGSDVMKYGHKALFTNMKETND